MTLAAGASGYIDMYIRDVGKADLIIETISTADVTSIKLYDGDGGPIQPSIAPVPYLTGVNAHGTDSSVFWDLGGTSYNMSSRTSNRQTVSVALDRSLGTDWVSIGIPTVTANTQINVRGRVL
jgi:hypothetical protein